MENTKANYEKVSKEIDKALAKRAKAKAAIEGEITAERAKLEQRQQKRESALLEGSQAEYLEAAADATRAENSIAFLEGRKRVLTEANKIPEEFMNECKAKIKAEQDRITKAALNSIRSKLNEILTICNDTIKSQEAGSEQLKRLIEAFAEDAPGQVVKYGSDYANFYQYYCLFGINYIPGIRHEIEKSLKGFEKYDKFMKGEDFFK